MVIGIISILVAISLPALSQARAAAARTQCKNNLRNVGLALIQVAETTGRFPASGNFGRNPATGNSQRHHSWVVDVLPWLEQAAISERWDKDRPIQDPENQPLTAYHVSVLVCPTDISVVREDGVLRGDLSYVVNGGVGFTVRYFNGVRDCPVDRNWTRLDLNGNGIACPPDAAADGDPSDRDHFLKMGVFFLETWKWDVTRRHHRIASIVDGLSQTILASENVRGGRDPSDPDETWASPNPYRHSFYIGNPCLGGSCGPGNVDYRRCNAGADAINSGLFAPEGLSPVPNAFHAGGVHMVFGDGRVQFVSQSLDGPVYAALASPQGMRLQGTPLQQVVDFGGDF